MSPFVSTIRQLRVFVKFRSQVSTTCFLSGTVHALEYPINCKNAFFDTCTNSKIYNFQTTPVITTGNYHTAER